MAAVVTGGCGGGDDDDGGGSQAGGSSKPPPAQTASSLKCLQKSIVDAELYSSPRDAGVEKGVRPLMTRRSKGGEILTGKLGAVVIEYPSTLAAKRAESNGRHSRVLTAYVRPKRITAIERTLLIDYAHDQFVLQIVPACARHPERPPPAPK